MTLKTKLDQQLAPLLSLPGPLPAPRWIAVDVNKGRVDCELLAVTPLACEFRELTLATDQLATADADTLGRVSGDLTRRLTYLLEPVCPIEVDQEQSTVLLRSSPPSQDEQRGRSYYELLVRRGGSVSLSRYRKLPGQPRQRTAAQVTREVLERLIGDMRAAACG